MDKNEHIDELIVRHLSEGLDDTDLLRLSHWLSQSEENKHYFNQLQEVWFATVSADDTLSFDPQRTYALFQARKKSAQTAERGKKHTFMRRMLKYAAVIIPLGLLTGAAAYVLFSDMVMQDPTDNYLVEAPLGAKAKVSLPDGTLVWLNAGSSMSYPRSFGMKERKVSLNGEAYFEVARNEHQAFTVQSNELQVRVLGTKFNFRNYHDELEGRVTLNEGRVAIKTLQGEKEVFLRQDQQFVFDKESRHVKIIDMKAHTVSDWIKGIIFFDEETLPDIARELERLYDVRIDIADTALLDYRFYGSFFRSSQSIREVFDILAATGKLNYTINEKQITLQLSNETKQPS